MLEPLALYLCNMWKLHHNCLGLMKAEFWWLQVHLWQVVWKIFPSLRHEWLECSSSWCLTWMGRCAWSQYVQALLWFFLLICDENYTPNEIVQKITTRLDLRLVFLPHGAKSGIQLALFVHFYLKLRPYLAFDNYHNCPQSLQTQTYQKLMSQFCQTRLHRPFLRVGFSEAQ